MKPIDWPKILANPESFKNNLHRLDERISHWPALCELCEVDPYKLAGFDLGLMILVRDFFQVVKRREWERARAMYDQVMVARAIVIQKSIVLIKPITQPVG